MAAAGVENLVGADASSSEDFTDAERALPSGTQVRDRRLRQLTIFSLGVVGVVALTAAGIASPLLERSGPVTTSGNASFEMKVKIKPFTQCGGKNWKGKGCCTEGCACIAKTPYYSMCATPDGVDVCDKREANGMAKIAMHRAKMATKNIQITHKALKKAQAHELEIEKELDAKRKVAVAKFKAGGKAKRAKLAAIAAAHAARKKANSTAKDAEDKKKEAKSVLDDSARWEAAEEKRKTIKKCGALYQPCVQGCCVEGCLCVHKKAYFDQCVAPKGSGGCNPTFEVKQRFEAKKKAKQLKEEIDNFVKLHKKQVADADDLDQKAKEAMAAAAKAGAIRVQAHAAKMKVFKVYKKAKVAVQHAKQVYEEAMAMRTYGPKNAKAWQAVVDGTACGGGDSALGNLGDDGDDLGLDGDDLDDLGSLDA